MKTATSPSKARPTVTLRHSTEVVLRFLIAAPIQVVLINSGFHNVRGMAGWTLACIVIPLAALWSARRISGMAMFNVTVATSAISTVAAASDPGSGSFDQVWILGGAAVATIITWLILLNTRLGDDRPLAPLLIAPALILATIALLRTDLPSRTRFGLSKASLDRFATEVLDDGPPHLDAIGGDEGSATVGLYQVIGVTVEQTTQGSYVQLVVKGDCGSDRECTLTYWPHRETDGESSAIDGDWYGFL